MARSEGFFRNTASNAASAVEFVDICEVLKAASGLLGEDEVRFPEGVDGEIVIAGGDSWEENLRTVQCERPLMG